MICLIKVNHLHVEGCINKDERNLLQIRKRVQVGYGRRNSSREHIVIQIPVCLFVCCLFFLGFQFETVLQIGEFGKIPKRGWNSSSKLIAAQIAVVRKNHLVSTCDASRECSRRKQTER